MGNGVPFNMLCCNPRKESQIEDIDLDKSKDYINYKTIKLSKTKELTNNNIVIPNKSSLLNFNLKKMQTHSKNSSIDESKKNSNYFRRDSASHRDPNISLFNNTFQILNNTQQYISFSNMNLLKNNLINNQLIKSLYNSKVNSSVINLSKINSNLEEFIDINIKLILTGDLFYNKIIEIDKFGMKNSMRQKQDGVTIFGYRIDGENPNNPLYDCYIDLNVVKKENNKRRKKRDAGKVFEIYLDRKEKVFVLNFVHQSLLLYYKIANFLSFELDRDYYLILGDIFLAINVKKAINPNEKIINIQVEVEDEKPKKYTFEQKDAPIRIGRANCSVEIPKPSISKLHSTIEFTDNNFIYKDAKSTNGSTLLIKEDDILKIKGEMNFKLEEISFKIKEIIIHDK